jgi:hypothetical protein
MAMFAGYSGHSAYSWGKKNVAISAVQKVIYRMVLQQCNGTLECTTSLFIKLRNCRIRTLGDRKSVGYETTVCTQGGVQGIRLQLEKGDKSVNCYIMTAATRGGKRQYD